ncbi:MAG TPA: serine/threonine-protein kinase [Anaeromyxobacteraceae bacterium]|nr:serine/threonine-protein kinase [Anaeromyxobacteraceae bacterium]
MAVRKVGSCRILREVGRGGMGVVYEAYQDGLDRRVAVKALDAKSARQADLAERFRREGRACARIRHPSLIVVHDLVEKDEGLYLVTEFVDGADLLDALGAGPRLPAEAVAAIGARVADALDCLHRSAILHRDVKPSNVMIAREGEVKLMDLGIAKDPLSTDLTRTGTVVGTPAYIAPEVLEGEPASEASDVWAAGVTLYEIATGAKPFDGPSFHELVAAVRRARPLPVRERAPACPRRLARAIERCLARDPARRWGTAGALARELDACAGRLLHGQRAEERLALLLVERGLSPAPAVADGPTVRFTAPGGGLDRLTWALVGALLLAGAVGLLAGR